MLARRGEGVCIDNPLVEYGYEESGIVTHAFNPSYLGGWDWENRGSRSAGQRLVRPASQQISWTWWLKSIIPAMQKVYIGGWRFRLAQAKVQDHS